MQMQMKEKYEEIIENAQIRARQNDKNGTYRPIPPGSRMF
jgi:hypothetical protein